MRWNSSVGKSASSTFVSCMQTTSGCVRSIHSRTCPRRARMEFTFQVTIFIYFLRLGAPHAAGPHTPHVRAWPERRQNAANRPPSRDKASAARVWQWSMAETGPTKRRVVTLWFLHLVPASTGWRRDDTDRDLGRCVFPRTLPRGVNEASQRGSSTGAVFCSDPAGLASDSRRRSRLAWLAGGSREARPSRRQSRRVAWSRLHAS